MGKESEVYIAGELLKEHLLVKFVWQFDGNLTSLQRNLCLKVSTMP